MTEPPDQWLPLPEAASRLGIAENALRSRIKRRTIRSRKDNQGRLLVCLAGPIGRTHTMVRSRSDPGSDHTIEPPPELRQQSSGAPEMVPASVVAAILEDHRQALERQERHHRESSSLLLERIDAAEVRAEQATATLNELVSKILTLVPAPPATSIWERWFGASRRSRLRSES